MEVAQSQGIEQRHSVRPDDDGTIVTFTRDHFHEQFDTHAYLQDFYTKIEDPAMQLVLQFLPSIVARLPRKQRLLDFGAGPTIHTGACFRNVVDEIYFADYLPQNRAELIRWKNCESTFDWSEALRMMLTREGIDWGQIKKAECDTRDKVSGIFHCDCFCDPSVECGEELQGNFDFITSVFTMEYCCNTHDEYRNATRNVIRQVAPGGYFIMGGILEETWCSFGGRRFTCLYITREFMLQCLEEAGLDVREGKMILIEVNGMFLVCARKHE